jgi:hypothetical protein
MEKLTPREKTQGIIDDRKHQLQQKFDIDSGQGILPLTNEKFYEQSNPVVRSALFSSTKLGKNYTEWTPIFSFGASSIQYRGPALTVEHELVLAKLMVLARGKSLTKPINAFVTDIRRWLNLGESGINFAKARRILDDLAAGEMKISDKFALRRLYQILTAPSVSERPDGKFFKDYIDNRFSDQLKMIASAIESGEPIEITMRFVSNRAANPRTGRLLISLDPITAIFFDGVNTTMLPFEIWEAQDKFGKKLLSFIASHRDGVFPIKLENYHRFSGSISDFQVVKRRVKSDLKKRCEKWEKEDCIEPGWSFRENNDGEVLLEGLKLSKSIRMKSELTLEPFIEHENTDEKEAQGARITSEMTQSFLGPQYRQADKE